MICLDTNVASEIGKSLPHSNVVAWLESQETKNIYLPSIVIMEMAFGAERVVLRTGSKRYRLALVDLVDRLDGRILGFGIRESHICGAVRAAREGAGRPITVQDAMIAAICLANGAMLATRNVRDFEGLDLKLANPFETA